VSATRDLVSVVVLNGERIMKWTRRSTVAFAAAALLTGAGVAIVATSTASPGGSGAQSNSHSSPTAGPLTGFDDGGGASGRTRHDDRGFDDNLAVSTDDPAMHDVGDDHGVDDPATHDIGDDHGVDNPATHDVGDDHGVDDPAMHDVGDDHGVSGSGSGSDHSGSDGHGTDH
jgi:hypothetical protein